MELTQLCKFQLEWSYSVQCSLQAKQLKRHGFQAFCESMQNLTSLKMSLTASLISSYSSNRSDKFCKTVAKNLQNLKDLSLFARFMNECEAKDIVLCLANAQLKNLEKLSVFNSRVKFLLLLMEQVQQQIHALPRGKPHVLSISCLNLNSKCVVLSQLMKWIISLEI